MAESALRSQLRAILDALPPVIAKPIRFGWRLIRAAFVHESTAAPPPAPKTAAPASEAPSPAHTPERSREEAVAEYWAIDRTRMRHSWLQHPTLLDFLHRRVSGDEKLSTYWWFKKTFFPQPVDLALVLGCGLGGFERLGIEIGFAKNFHAHDISPGAIEQARQAAAEAGMADKIDYFVTDLNRFSLPAQTYDAVFIIMAAHHISELENLFAQVSRALKPAGLLFLDEYIGPNQFQCPPLAVDVINRLLAAFPARYRLNLIAANGSTVDSFTPPAPQVFEQNDPSEAIRSADIVLTLKQSFDLVEFRPYGGAILHMLFSGIMGNFDENKETDVALLNSIAIFEETLEKTGALESDFAAIVARPRDSSTPADRPT